MLSMKAWSILMICAPLLGALIAGIARNRLTKRMVNVVTIAGVGLAFLIACVLFYQVVLMQRPGVYSNVYTWITSGRFSFHLGLMIDAISVMMAVVVTFVSLLVHIYSIGYMRDDPGYARFFAYMSLFTFAMLLLVTANNLLQIFIGWEGVGLVSYLLIGFWFHKPSAADAAFKAFIVNRVGDFGFVLGIACLFTYTGTLDYRAIFQDAPHLLQTSISLFPHHSMPVVTLACLLLFVGAMGKSAQLPLHIWLPGSMEGPTPISALIHAATMVTAGVFMVARMSPLFELSPAALSVVLIVGATGALLLGLLAITENDIKRVIAFSTMSQLGYMMAANGASAFSAGMFHLFTHACFKALLFLAAGSVIMGMHHEQDLRKMGGLAKKMPITYLTFLIGSLALVAIPPFAGFYSKDAIIEAVGLSTIAGAHYAYWCLILGALVTAIYTFRAFFMAFHGEPRMSSEAYAHVHESPWVVTVPLLLLAIPSVCLGMAWAYPLLYAPHGWLSGSIMVVGHLDVMATLAKDYHGAFFAILHALASLPFWMAILGVLYAYVAFLRVPTLPAAISGRFPLVTRVLKAGYGFDQLNTALFGRLGSRVSTWLYQFADMKCIDALLVNGSGRGVLRIASWLRRLQTGYLYHYIFVMMVGLLVLLYWLLLGR